MACPYGVLSGISLAIVALQICRKCLPWLYENIIGPLVLGGRVNFPAYGDWALITGATDGIGKSYAKQLAKHGKNVVLVSRSKSKLEVVAAEIEAEYKVKTKIIDVDFTGGPEIYARIQRDIEGLRIGILVNNVGVSYSYPEYFLDVPNLDQLMADIVSVNVVSVTNMCKLILPRMLADQKGIIINISSMAGTIPNPMLTIYSASKAFVDKFSEDLQTEYGSQGIIVQSVLPGFVATNMTGMKRSTLMAPSPDKYAESALKTLSYARHTFGYLPHAFMQLCITTMHYIVPEYTNSTTLKHMEGIKKRALKRTKAN